MPTNHENTSDNTATAKENNLFNHWNELKKNLNQELKVPLFKEGEIWWCGVGKNIGVEIYGKSRKFSRPVLILRKLNKYCFMGIPLTSQPHKGSWYVHFSFLEKTQTAVLSQAKVMNYSRLYGKIGTAPDSDLEQVRQGFIKLYGKNMSRPSGRGRGYSQK